MVRGPSSRQRSGDTSLPTERKTILVVDDEAELRTTLRIALENEGFAFDSAGNGLAALQKVRERAPDLVILDLNMPHMGGEEFLYAWRAGVEARGVPVVVITATSDALKPTDLGVEAVLAKPFEIDNLLWHVRDLLALPAPAASRGHDSLVYARDIVEDLAQVMSTLLVTAEQIAEAPNVPDEVRPLATTALGTAHRASALVRRLVHIIGSPE